MTYSPTLLALIEDLRKLLVKDIVSHAGEINDSEVEFMNDHFVDAENRIWYEFNFSAHGEPFAIWARLNANGHFVSVVDTEDVLYYGF